MLQLMMQSGSQVALLQRINATDLVEVQSVYFLGETHRISQSRITSVPQALAE
jgi:hypothetical protein